MGAGHVRGHQGEMLEADVVCGGWPGIGHRALRFDQLDALLPDRQTNAPPHVAEGIARPAVACLDPEPQRGLIECGKAPGIAGHKAYGADAGHDPASCA